MLGYGYYYYDIERQKTLCTHRVWPVIDAMPIRRGWQIMRGDMLYDKLATQADRTYMDHQRAMAKLFKSVVTMQATVLSQITGNVMPVEYTVQYDYNEYGVPFAMWGYMRTLRPKWFGLCVKIIHAKQAALLQEEGVRQQQQSGMLAECAVTQK